MSCEGCKSRRERLKRWLRDKLGVTALLLHNQRVSDKHLGDWVNIFDDHIERGRASTEQLDKIVETEFGLTKDNITDVRERMNIFRELIRSRDHEIRKLREELKDLDMEMSEMSERVMKIEYPGFNAVGYNLDDKPS